MPDSPEVKHFEKSSKQDNNNIKLSPVKAGKCLRTAVANGKPASGKLSWASTNLIQDELLPSCLEARNLENSSNQDDNNVRLFPMRAGKKPRTATANKKMANSKLWLASTELPL